MKKQIVAVLLATSLAFSFAGCGNSKEEPAASSSGVNADLPTSERNDVIAALMGTVRNFEPDLELPENNSEYTIAKVDGHYNLAGTAKRPDGSNAMIVFWVDIEGKNYSVHYFSVKDDIYVDDGVIEE